MQLGYFQVIAEPVSTCVQEIFEVRTAAIAALGHEVVDTAFAVLITRIPVLHGRVFNFCVIEGHQLDNGRMQLVFVAHRRRATFEVTDVAAFVGDHQGALELTGIGCVDPK